MTSVLHMVGKTPFGSTTGDSLTQRSAAQTASMGVGVAPKASLATHKSVEGSSAI